MYIHTSYVHTYIHMYIRTYVYINTNATNCRERERDKLIHNTSNQDKWPVVKSDLVKKHIKHFIQFANSIDFEKL